MRIILMVLVVLVVLTAVPVFAQYEVDRPAKFGLAVSQISPTDSNLRKYGNYWTGVALDYYPKLDEDERPTGIVQFGLAGSGDGRASRNWASYSFLRRKPISASRTRYMGFGPGVYSLKFPGDGKVPPRVTSGNTYVVGAHASYGMDFHNSYFLEARADLLPKWKGVGWSGISLNFGTKLSL